MLIPKCRKCGYNGASTVYDQWRDDLKHKCGRCGYQWVALPLDRRASVPALIQRFLTKREAR